MKIWQEGGCNRVAATHDVCATPLVPLAEKTPRRLSRGMMKRLTGLVLALVVLVVMTSTAQAQSGRDLRFVLVFAGCEGDPGRVVLTGAITGVGVDIRQGFRQNPDGTFVFGSLMVLADGTLRIGGGGRTESFQVDPRAGVARFSFTGSFEIVEGTGAFEGANGSGTFAGRGVLVPDDRCPSGARAFQVSHATGSVTFAEPAAV